MLNHFPALISRCLLFAIVVTLCGALTVQVTGCSLIALGIGGAADGSRPPKRMGASGFAQVEPGTRIGLIVRDGAVIRGRYIGTGRVTPSQYAAHYERWRQEHGGDSWTPVLGDSILVTHSDATLTRGTFLGFSYHALEMRPDGGTSARRVPFDRLARVSAGDAAIGVQALRDLEAAGTLPCLTALGIENERRANRSIMLHGRDTTFVGMDRVAAVEVPAPGGITPVLLLMGLAADVLVVRSWNREMASCGSSFRPSPRGRLSQRMP